jgi:alpha-L-fucosidase 2
MDAKWLTGLLLCLMIQTGCATKEKMEITPSVNDLTFNELPRVWDEAVPLGNGMLGALVWERDGKLRFGLDRADLWDLRPTEKIFGEGINFQWVVSQVKKNDYAIVQEILDKPYVDYPYPTKIPGGALEFDISELGEVESVQLVLNNALCIVKWKSGAVLKVFVHATEPAGWFRFENLGSNLIPELITPGYDDTSDATDAEMTINGMNVSTLGYEKGNLVSGDRQSVYQQKTWGGASYEIAMKWRNPEKKVLEGIWSISSDYPHRKCVRYASDVVKDAFGQSFGSQYESHHLWWSAFWSQSSVAVPDTAMEKQYYLEMYKLGAASRRGAPPISLQAVWTRDNGRLPPWKGDYHHDINTQQSYWPCYSSNHLEEGLAFTDWLWDIRDAGRAYTRRYFGTGGLNIPGVCTLTGEPMGGWIQYAMSPTISSWLGHHFYSHWRYSMDRNFLKTRAYPWLSETAVYLEELCKKDPKTGFRKLPLSSHPEYNLNRIDAWYTDFTNYDLALVRWTFDKAAELAGELGLQDEKEKWLSILKEFPGYTIDETEGLKIAPNESFARFQLHFSHLMAIYPLDIFDWNGNEADRIVIQSSLEQIDRVEQGDKNFGFGIPWYAIMRARMGDGDRALKVLQRFPACCSPNSFNFNYDQTQPGAIRVFTLEANFGFAAAIQEMLLQSYKGIIRIFPAVPTAWKDLSFDKLRAEGAFLVSAAMKGGNIEQVKIISEKGGDCTLENPWPGKSVRIVRENGETGIVSGDLLIIKMIERERISLAI